MCLEIVAEVEQLILDRVTPVVPVVNTLANIEVVLDTSLQQLLVQGAVHTKEEVVVTAVDDKAQLAWLQTLHKVDYGMLLPVLWVLLDSAEPF